MDSLPENELIEKGLPCPACSSSDALALYSDGHSFCFSCRKSFKGDKPPERSTVKSSTKASSDVDIAEALKGFSYKALLSRKINLETCQKFGYMVRQRPSGAVDHAAIYRDANGQPLWLKIRHCGTKEEPAKGFSIVGPSDDTFFGQHLWSKGGKRLVIAGGELDALTVSQAMDNQWPVVSPPKGENGLEKAIRAQLQWVLSFDEVVLGMDMDKVGREANLAAAHLLPAGKVKIAKWTQKDPNEMLLKGEGKEVIRCVWNAEVVHPDGIVDAREVDMSRPTMGLPWPWRNMTNWTLGRRPGEVYTFGGGTGLGKSDTLYEVVSADIQGRNREGDTWEPQKWAMFTYEAGPGRVKLEILSKVAQKRFKIPQGHPKCLWTEADYTAAMELLDIQCGGRLFLMDGKGAPDWERVKDLARFLKHTHGVAHFAVDPVSAMVAGEDEERKMLDGLFIDAANLAEELQASFYIFSHLTRPKEGKGHEEGAPVRLGQFRGSNGIGMFSAFVIGYERDQSADTPEERCVATIRMVKDRLLGDSTGETFKLHYDRLSGTLDCAIEDTPEGADGYGEEIE